MAGVQGLADVFALGWQPHVELPMTITLIDDGVIKDQQFILTKRLLLQGQDQAPSNHVSQ
jgi:hypothetical protein